KPLRSDKNWRESGKAQASFILELLSIGGDDFRVHESDQLRAVLPSTRIGHQDPLGNTHLIRSKPDSRSVIHGFHHVLHELDLRIGNVGDRLRGFLEDFVTEENYRTQH